MRTRNRPPRTAWEWANYAALVTSCVQERGGSRRPEVVCLCGSTRFSQVFQDANLCETLAGRIVLTIGCDLHSDGALFASMDASERAVVKANLDRLHLQKIDLADTVLVLNVGGYVGASTRTEIGYAVGQGKHLRWWEPEKAPAGLEQCPCPVCRRRE